MRKIDDMPTFFRNGIWSVQITLWGSSKITKSETQLIADAARLTASILKQWPEISGFQSSSRGLQGKIRMKIVIKWKIEVLQIIKYVTSTMGLRFLDGANNCKYWRSSEIFRKVTATPYKIPREFRSCRFLVHCQFSGLLIPRWITYAKSFKECFQLYIPLMNPWHCLQQQEACTKISYVHRLQTKSVTDRNSLSNKSYPRDKGNVWTWISFFWLGSLNEKL